MHQPTPSFSPDWLVSNPVTVQPTLRNSTLQQHAPGVLDELLDLHQELDGLLAVEQTVVVGQSQVHHGPGLDLAVHNDGALLDGVETQDRGLGQVDDGRAHERAEDTSVADGESTASHVLERELAVACL